jgi:hypothetical protein
MSTASEHQLSEYYNIVGEVKVYRFDRVDLGRLAGRKANVPPTIFSSCLSSTKTRRAIRAGSYDGRQYWRFADNGFIAYPTARMRIVIVVLTLLRSVELCCTFLVFCSVDFSLTTLFLPYVYMLHYRFGKVKSVIERQSCNFIDVYDTNVRFTSLNTVRGIISLVYTMVKFLDQ